MRRFWNSTEKLQAKEEDKSNNQVISEKSIDLHGYTLQEANEEISKFIDKLYASGVQDLKIIENFEIQESEEFDINEDENTLSILNRYIEESEFDLDKNIIKNIFQDLYREACEVE